MTDQPTKDERIEAYKDKQDRKLERYNELAEKNHAESKRVYEHGHNIADAIPFGQPILVGHHSERKHRKDLERIHNSMDKSIKLKEKAEHYEAKAENIVNPDSIRSDNPEAIDLLQTKIADLEKTRTAIKAYNLSVRKGKPDLSLLDDRLRGHLARFKDVWKEDKFPSYELTNLGANIRRIKERIEQLSHIEKIEEIEETVNNITLKVDKLDNRVRLHFPGKPSQEVIQRLKQNGFKWSPYNMAWQRMLNETSLYLARQIMESAKV